MKKKTTKAAFKAQPLGDIVSYVKWRVSCTKDKKVPTAALVRTAANPENILHDKLCWDDATAADRYRNIQMRRVVARCRDIMPSPTKTCNIMARALVSLSPDRAIAGGGYRATADVLDDKPKKRTMVRDAARDLAMYASRYHNIQELAGVHSAIARLMRTLKSEDESRRSAAEKATLRIARKRQEGVTTYLKASNS